MSVQLKGLKGEFSIYQQNGVFLNLRLIVDGLPVRCSCAQWGAVGGTYDNMDYRYSYGEITTHQKNVIYPTNKEV